jgi:hypothetical protein
MDEEDADDVDAWRTLEEQQLAQLQSTANRLGHNTHNEDQATTTNPETGSGNRRRRDSHAEEQGEMPPPTTPSGRSDNVSQDALHPLRSRAKEIIASLTVSPHIDAVKDLLKNAKNSREVKHIIDHYILAHPFANDILNGHGFRVAAIVAVMAFAGKTNAVGDWFDLVERFRSLGFTVARQHVSEASMLVRNHIQVKFDADGRAPHLINEGLDRMRQILNWCAEDKVVMDPVLLGRFVACAVTLVSFFDRQNVFRTNFGPTFSKRDAIVQEWALCRERAVDYDRAVELCDVFVEEILQTYKKHLPNSQFSYSFTYRLFDYYFASDNVEKMLELLSTCEREGMIVAEAVTAKTMQLITAFNYPNAEQLFLRWRVANPQSALSSADATRMLFYYGRAGGGYACPKCGEKYNHRNVSLSVWKATPPDQRDCAYATMARLQRAEFDDLTDTPQGRDWSAKAMGIWRLCDDRGLRWGTIEWRNFLRCFLHSATPVALEALALLDRSFPAAQFDDFLCLTYCKLLRKHRPEVIVAALEGWRAAGTNHTPIVLQEAAIAAVRIPDEDNPPVSAARRRLDAIAYCIERIRAVDSYIASYTQRHVESIYLDRCATRQRQGTILDAVDLKDADEERQLVEELMGLQQRTARHDSKPSVWDLGPLRQRKNMYVAPGVKATAPKNSGGDRYKTL